MSSSSLEMSNKVHQSLRKLGTKKLNPSNFFNYIRTTVGRLLYLREFIVTFPMDGWALFSLIVYFIRFSKRSCWDEGLKWNCDKLRLRVIPGDLIDMLKSVREY